jgi:hypothetical protein
VSFGRATFSGDADFYAATFGKYTYFPDALFLAGADFRLGVSPGNWRAGLIAAAGEESSGISNSTITLDRNFAWAENAAFHGISFENCEFWGDVTFENRKFLETTSFAGAAFFQIAGFHGAQLHPDTDFTDSPELPTLLPPAWGVKNPTRLHRWRQKRQLRMIAAQLRASKRATLLEKHFLLWRWVKQWHLKRTERHENGIIKAKDQMRSLKRSLKAPQPEGRRREIESREVKLRPLLEEAAKIYAEDRRVDTVRAAEFERAYRRLKNLMEDIRARGEEGRFFTLEIRSRMKRVGDKEVSFAERLAARLYGGLADYGRSITRPFLWIVVLAGLLTLLGWGISRAPPVCGLFSLPSVEGVSPVSCALPPAGPPLAASSLVLFFLQSLFPLFLFSQLDLFGSTSGTSSWIEYLLTSGTWRSLVFDIGSIVHAVLNVILWFLFALALRRKFQID